MNQATLNHRQQHVVLILLISVSISLAAAYRHTRIQKPRIQTTENECIRLQQETARMTAQIQARQQQDLPSLQIAVSEVRQRLRTVELTGETDGAPLVNARSQPQVAAFQALISRTAETHGLAVVRHAAVSAPGPELSNLVVRDLEISGRFAAIISYIQSLGSLPNRIIILSLDLSIEPTTPGNLRVVLRYSV